MSFLDEFRAAMVAVGQKQVTKTDKKKQAYIPNEQQRRVMSEARIEPQGHESSPLINICVAGTNDVLSTSYYPSRRAGSGRLPEIRMGRGLVHYVQEGDTLWLGTDGSTVFVLKLSSPLAVSGDEEETDEAIERLARMVNLGQVLERARNSVGSPDRRETQSMVFERNPWVRDFARLRSDGHCEMPGCDYVGFEKPDGTPYIEVHHIQSMADTGDDVIENVAAICPDHHAQAHYGKDHEEIQLQLLGAIRTANEQFFSNNRLA
jgi:hypothetical protein